MTNKRSDGGRKPLSYSNMDELNRACRIDLKTLDFNKPQICNSLLKMFDKGNEFLRERDDEKAYIMLMRFFEGFMELRKSRIYKEDKRFVDNFITPSKLDQTMTHLEKLKDELKTRYDDKLPKHNEPKEAAPGPDLGEELAEKIRFSPKSLNPKELVDLLTRAAYRVLIMDVRPRNEFDSCHMELKLMLNDEKKRQLVSYMNLPTECVQNVSWSIADSLKSYDPATSALFADRNKFDYLVLFDRDSKLDSLTGESKLGVLKRALFEYDIDACKNEPVILEGGWKQWLVYYPSLVSSLNRVDGADGEKKSVDKLFDFDYPELESDKRRAVAPVKPVPPAVNEIKLEPVEDLVEKVQPNIEVVTKPSADTNSNKPPVINRSNKPEPKVEPKQAENTPPPPIITPSTSTEIRPSPGPVRPTPVPRPTEPTAKNLDEEILNTVYMPVRNNRPIQTPYMKEGSTKTLDTQTGLFLYNPPSEPTPPTFNKPTPPVAQKPTPKPAGPLKPAPDTKSNLKRTFSSPNIAKLEEDKLDIDEETDKKTIINSLNQPELEKKTVVSNRQVEIKQPIVNRNSKPMPDHVMRARFEELQPVFGNAHPGLTGIRNLGNTCFMNSIIQCLSSSQRLVKYFMSGQHRKDLNRSNELGFRGEIADEFSVIIKAIWDGHCRIISPRRFKIILGQFNQQFVSNEQQDAQELLLFLLDGLHEDLNRVINRPKINNKDDENEKLSDQQMAALSWNIHLSINNSIIVDLFQVLSLKSEIYLKPFGNSKHEKGQFKSTVNCLSCGKKSVKFDAFMYLTLPLPSQKCDIYQCLELFLQPERMSGESKWKCPKCKEYRDAVKKIDIWRLPPLLIVHLKRFKYHGLWRDKITTQVDYPVENLNLDRYVMGARTNPNNYHLYAVSNHSGTLDGGHYTAICRHFEYGRWFKFDDSEVKEVSNLSSIRSPLSYILFYSL